MTWFGHLILYWLILLFSVHDIEYSVIFYFSIYHVVIVHTVYMHEHFSISYTLTGSLSDDPRFARSDIRCFVSIVQVFIETVCFARSWTLPIRFWYSFLSLFLLLFCDSCISHLASLLFLISFEIMCSNYIYYCSDRWLLWLKFIPYSGYFKLSAYTWGIFLAYMRRPLLSRLRCHVFWEAGHDRVFLVSEPGST